MLIHSISHQRDRTLKPDKLLEELDTELDGRATEFLTVIRTDKSRYARNQFRLIRSPLDLVNNLLAGQRYAQVDFGVLFFRQGQPYSAGIRGACSWPNSSACAFSTSPPLRRKQANLPAGKALDSFDFGFAQRLQGTGTPPVRYDLDGAGF